MTGGVMVLALFGSILPDSSSSDTLPLPDPVENIDELQDDTGGAVLLDDLQWLQDHPYDLNSVSYETLLSIPSVSEQEAAAVIRFRDEKGRFNSVLQLLTMEGGGAHAYAAISPYVAVAGNRSHATVLRLNARGRLTGQIPVDTTREGSPWRSYNRLWINPDPAVEVGVLFERDPGERTRDAFTSAYVSVFNAFKGIDATVGDFSVESGQGLLLWRGNSIGKSAWAVTGPRRSARGIVPHRSSSETNFFRGGAVTGRWPALGGRWEVIGFVSMRHAGLDGSTDVPVPVTGARVTLSPSEQISLGATAVRSLSRRRPTGSNPMRFRGNRLDAAGADLRLSSQSLNLFGEVALCSGGGSAIAVGLGVVEDGGFSALIHYRDYSPRFDNPFAGGFGDDGDTRNERGVYLGFMHTPLPWLRVRMYYDQFIHPMPNGISRFPTAANDLLVEAEGDLTSRISLSARYALQYGHETRAGRDNSGRETRDESDRTQERWRLTLSLDLSRHIRFTTRLERARLATRSAGNQRGYLIYQDLRISLPPFIATSARLVLFDSDSYDARLYSFESDLPGQFSSQVLYGTGRRLYLIARFTPARYCTLSLKAAWLGKEPGITTGIQPQEILQHRRIDFGAQLDIRL